MKRLPQEKSFTARALTDPQPSFVAMCKAGANQRPFRVVKMDPSALEPANSKETEMSGTKKTDQNIALAVGNGYEIAQLRFKGDAFDTEAKVKAWLDDGGYVDYEIEQKEDGSFEINSDYEFQTGTIRRIDANADGVSAFVGKLTGAKKEVEKSKDEVADEHAVENTSAVTPVAEGTETGAVEAAEKNEGQPETALRFDDFEAYYSEDASLSGVLAAGDDGFPGGLYELTNAMYFAVRNAIRNNQSGEIDTIAADYGRRVQLLAQAFNGMDDAQRAQFEDKVLGSGSTETIVEKAEETAEEDGAVAEATEEQPADAAEAAPAEGSEAVEEAEGDAPAEAAAEEAARGDNPVLAAVKALGDNLAKAISEVKGEIDTVKSSFDERVAALETRGQTRKGADEPTGDLEDKVKTSSAKSASRLRSALGSQFVSAEDYDRPRQ